MADVQLADLGTVIKTAYESQPNTNAFTDAEKAKLASIEAGATADMTPAEVEAAYNGAVGEATQQEAEAGIVTDIRRWSPARIKQAIEALAPAGGGPSSPGIWGQITGTLSDQTDLQAALDAKANVGDLGALALKSVVEHEDIGAGEIAKDLLDPNVFEDEAGVKAGTAEDEAINAKMLRYFAGLYWPIDSRSTGDDFTEILGAHAGALIKTDRNMTLDSAFAGQQTFMLWNVDSNPHTLTVEAGAGGNGLINGQTSVTIAPGGLAIVVIESNAGDEPTGAVFGDLSPLDLPSGTTLDSETIVTAEGAQLVASDANNELTVNAPIWVGTETNYGNLTPDAGTIYLVKADA